jgi:signal transduction histidine kinase
MMYLPPTAKTFSPEENLQQASAEELAAQAAHFSSQFITRPLLDAMPGIVFILNQYRQIVFANRNLCDLLNLETSESLLGKRPGDVMDCHSALQSEYGCGTGDACETCGALSAIVTGLDGQEDIQECLLTRQTDESFETLTLRFWASPLDYNGETYVVLAGMDISHERRRLALERTFFHDILNLIGSIRGFAELMQQGDETNHAEVSRLIHNTAQRVIDEIDAQKLLLAVEKHELEVNRQVLNSKAMLTELVDLYQLRILPNVRPLKLDPHTEDVSFVSDAAILGRVLGNMVKNALEASQSEDEIILGAETENGRLVLWVRNPAVIPQAYHPRIFQRDFSTKGVGRGLGTYGMKLLGEALSGEVSFSSSDEDGTVFRVVLPLGEASQL